MWKAQIRDMSWLKERVTVDPVTDCWEWNLARNKLGYGHYGVHTGDRHVTKKAHRLAFELGYGYLPATVLHRCDNPPCCNPAHLRGETQADNVRDMIEKGRHAHAALTRAQAEEIRAALAAGAVGAHLAHAYRVTDTAISAIKLGKTWKVR